MKSKVKIGIVQMNVLSNFYDNEVRYRNVKTAVKLINELVDKDINIDIIILPEEFYAGGGYGPFSLPDNKDEIQIKVFNELSKIAKDKHTYICGGLSMKFNPEDMFKSNNAGFIIDRNGKVLDFQERFHCNPTEAPYTIPGNKLKVYDLDFGKVGIVMGLDIMYPEIARKLALEGVEIILSPIMNPGIERKKENTESCFPNDLYRECAIARAIENQIFVVMVNSVGEFVHSDLNLIGESMVAGPSGTILKCDNSECIKICELDIKNKVSAKNIFDLLKIRNKYICQIGEEI